MWFVPLLMQYVLPPPLPICTSPQKQQNPALTPLKFHKKRCRLFVLSVRQFIPPCYSCCTLHILRHALQTNPGSAWSRHKMNTPPSTNRFDMLAFLVPIRTSPHLNLVNWLYYSFCTEHFQQVLENIAIRIILDIRQFDNLGLKFLGN